MGYPNLRLISRLCHATRRSSLIAIWRDPKFEFNCDLEESEFKPDLVVMSLQDARVLHKLEKLDTPRVSEFIDEIAGKPPSDFTCWKAVLSAVELKQNEQGWPPLEVFNCQDRQVSVTGIQTNGSTKPDPPEPTTCKMNVSQSVYTLKTSCTAVSSATLVPSKRSAVASAETSGSERQRVEMASFKTATNIFALQYNLCATEKLANSFSISHVLNPVR